MDEIINDITVFFSQPNAYRSVLILIASVVLAYVLSKFLADFIIKIAQAVSVRSDNESNEERFVRLRQVETYLSVAVALVRAAVVAVVAYVVWRIVSPVSSSGLAAIGAGTFFIVFAGQTLGMVLRDITAGAMIIIEQWFHVGDYVKIEPFMNVTGVVERLTLRSTKIRALSGEVIWIHNQQIAAAHVTPRGIRTIAVDIFVRDKEKGMVAIEELIGAMPVSPTMLAARPRIGRPEECGPHLWCITVTGQTAPGREWLIERYFVDEIKEIDKDVEKKADRIFAYDPIARFADPVADKKFKRAVRVRREQ